MTFAGDSLASISLWARRLSVVPVIALTACFGSQSPEDLVRSAKANIEKGELRTAGIELKNALQAAPNSAVARFLLGKSLFLAGDAAAAEVEVRKAAQLGYPEAEVAPLLAGVLLARNEYRKVIEEFGTKAFENKAVTADLKASVASALAWSGDLKRARSVIDEALVLDPALPRAKVLRARLIASSLDFEAATQAAQALIDDKSTATDGWMLMGDLRQRKGGAADAAIEAYRQVLAIQPGHLLAHSSLIAIHLQRNDVSQFEQQLAALKKARPGEPQVRFFEAQLAFVRGDYKNARTLTQQLLAGAPSNPRLLQFSGMIELQLGALAQAEATLNKALRVADDPGTRTLLAQVLLREGQAERAMQALTPLLEGPSASHSALVLAAESRLMLGNSQEAEQLYGRAAKLDPRDIKAGVALALLEFSKGKSNVGFQSLEAIASQRSEVHADLALIAARLQRNEVQAALRAVDALERKEPASPRPNQLRARVQLQAGDFSGARASLEKSLATSPGYYPAAAMLAGMDASEGRFDLAQERMLAVLKHEPANVAALRALAELAAKGAGPKDEVVRKFEAALAADPADVTSRVMYADYLLSVKDAKAAVGVAQAGIELERDRPELLDALGRAHMAAGDSNQALAAFGRVAALLPRSATPHLRMAEAYSRAENDQAAMTRLKTALDLDPGSEQILRTFIRVALRAKQVDEALQIARKLQKSRDDAVGHLMEGDIFSAQRKWDPAVAAYRAGLSRKESGVLATRVHMTLVSAKREAEAARFASEWSAKHPENWYFNKHLGDMALAQREFPTAVGRYEKVLEANPNELQTLNNLAWARLELKRPGAVSVARRAVELAPGQVTFLDTLAQAFLAEGDAPRAVAVARRILQIEGRSPAHRLSMIKVLASAGERGAARQELDRMSALPSGSPLQAELDRLRRDLSK